MAAVAPLGDLSERDQAVVRLVAQFRQMTKGQIAASLFAGHASATPLDRTLKRLVERKHLGRLQRLVGGDHGGSAQYVYQLGREGWRMIDRAGAYWAPRAVNLHALAVADCHGWLKLAEHRGEVEVVRFVTEPECHQAVGDVLLTPDAYVELGSRVTKTKQTYWLEVDRGTEHLRTIQEKCVRYWRAYQSWPSSHFPRVLFVVPDDQRHLAIDRTIGGGPVDARKIFSICVRSENIGDVALC